MLMHFCSKRAIQARACTLMYLLAHFLTYLLTFLCVHASCAKRLDCVIG